MKSKRIGILSFLIICSLVSCQKIVSIEKIILKPKVTSQLECDQNTIILGEFQRISAPGSDASLYLLKKEDKGQVYSFEIQSSQSSPIRSYQWRLRYQYAPPLLGEFPVPVFYLNHQVIFMFDSNSLYKVDMSVNTRKEFFQCSEIGFDQGWVIWKTPQKNPSEKSPLATIMNLVTEEMKTIKIPSVIESLTQCSDYLLISTRAKPNDAQKWWAYDWKGNRLRSLGSYGEKVYSSKVSDVLYWSSKEKKQWSVFSLSQNKVLKQFSFSVLPDGSIVPFTQNGLPAFWWRDDLPIEFNQVILGILNEKNQLKLMQLQLPQPCHPTDFLPDTGDYTAFWMQHEKTPNSFYLLTYRTDQQFTLQEVKLNVDEIVSFMNPTLLKRVDEFTILATQSRLLTFTGGLD